MIILYRSLENIGTIFQKMIDDPAILDEIKQDLINNNIL
jgi:hypothetical protein